MLVRYFTRVRAPHRHVESVIGALTADDGAHGAEAAYRQGEELRQTLQPIAGGFAKDVLMSIGTARIRRDGVAYPLTWRATGATTLFPRMEAELVISPIGTSSSSIVFEGTYDPPFGVVGEAVDRALLNKVAEMTVKSWVDDLVEDIESSWRREQVAPAPAADGSSR